MNCKIFSFLNVADVPQIRFKKKFVDFFMNLQVYAKFPPVKKASVACELPRIPRNTLADSFRYPLM